MENYNEMFDEYRKCLNGAMKSLAEMEIAVLNNRTLANQWHDWAIERRDDALMRDTYKVAGQMERTLSKIIDCKGKLEGMLFACEYEFVPMDDKNTFNNLD